MKKDLHPTDYRPVVFEDTSNGFKFLTRSTATSDETIKWEDGKEYPLIKTHISSASHPFYTGKEKVLDLEGRVDRFKAKAAKAAALRQESAKRKSTAGKPGKTESNKPPVAQKIGAGPQKPDAKPSPETTKDQ